MKNWTAQEITAIIQELIDLKIRLALADAVPTVSVIRSPVHKRIDELSRRLTNLLSGEE